MAISSKRESRPRRNRLIIGGNVALAILIVGALVVFVNFLTARLAPPAFDCTRLGQFSISSRTVKLLEGLSEPVILTAMYRVSEEEEPQQKQQAQEQKRRVEDLLRRYADISSKISFQMIDPVKDTAAKTKLVRRLVDKYSGQMVKHKELVKNFSDLANKIKALLEREQAEIEKLIDTYSTMKDDRNIRQIRFWFYETQEAMGTTIDQINALTAEGDVPQYSEATRQIRTHYESVSSNLSKVGGYLSVTASKIQGLDEKDAARLRDTPQRYQELIDQLNKEVKVADGLPPLELEKIYRQIKQTRAKTILVETDTAAKVLPFGKIWVFSEKIRIDEKRKYDFTGETAISSAILALTSKEKTAVVFVHAGPPSPIKPGFAQMRRTPAKYRLAKNKLEELNFVVEDWDIRIKDTPPEIEEVKRNVYVIMPPPPPAQPQPGRPPTPSGYEQKHIDIIEKQLIDKGERMMFLARFSPLMMGVYPFTDLLSKKFGLKIEPDRLVIRSRPMKDKLVLASLGMGIQTYESHAITEPIQSLNTTFMWPVPITINATLPEAVTVAPLVHIGPELANCWAESNLGSLRKFVDKDEFDTAPPFDLVVAVENSKTGLKAVVFSDDQFVTDESVYRTVVVATGGGLAYMLANPGSLELFANCAFWLNDNENMIAVGPRQDEVPRIEHISEGGMFAWKVFLWIIWPLAALAAGGVVHLVRRK